MAKPGSSSGPRLQGTLLPVLLLLLLASSIQAGPVTASELEPFVGVFEKLTVTVLGKIKGLEDFTKGLKWGFRIDKYGHKAEAALMGKQNPGPAGGGTAHAIIHTVSVVTSSITGGTSYRGIFFVSTADITATAAVSTGFCAKQRVSVSPSSIRLFGGGRSVSLTPFPVPGRLLECPVVAGGAPAWVALGLGRDGDLSRRFPRFSYTVTSYLNTLVDLSPPLPGRGISTSTPLFRNPMYPNDGRYYVDVAGIWVGQKFVQTARGELGVRPGDGTGGGLYVYLSTTDYYTVLESGVYGLLKGELMRQIKGATLAQLGPADRDRLCYNVNVATELTVPPMAIVFHNDAVMQLTGPNVWEVSSSTICLAIRPTTYAGQASILGSRLQSGRTMTVDLTAGAGAQGTLTFCGLAICVHA